MTRLTTCVTQLASPATDPMFSRILTSALIAGAAAGLCAAALQLLFVQPVLLHAELYESGDLVHFGGGASLAAAPEFPMDLMRDALSVLFSMLIYAGYGLVLVAAMSFAEEQGATISARTGIIWGVAGFIAVQFAPGVSLAPELPGSSAADVGVRQVWWWATVVAAAVGLWLIAFGRNWPLWVLAVALLLVPHLVGAPMPEEYTGPVPPELAALFAARALGIGLAAWVLTGLFAGMLWSQSQGEAS